MRLHLLNDLPSVEGLLLARLPDEYRVGLPELMTQPGHEPDRLASRELRIPRERVAFYEVLA